MTINESAVYLVPLFALTLAYIVFRHLTAPPKHNNKECQQQRAAYKAANSDAYIVTIHFKDAQPKTVRFEPLFDDSERIYAIDFLAKDRATNYIDYSFKSGRFKVDNNYYPVYRVSGVEYNIEVENDSN